MKLCQKDFSKLSLNTINTINIANRKKSFRKLFLILNAAELDTVINTY